MAMSESGVIARYYTNVKHGLGSVSFGFDSLGVCDGVIRVCNRCTLVQSIMQKQATRINVTYRKGRNRLIQ